MRLTSRDLRATITLDNARRIHVALTVAQPQTWIVWSDNPGERITLLALCATFEAALQAAAREASA